MRKYDIVLFGATGFTGELVAEQLRKMAESEGRSWAIAGRNLEKLETIRERLGDPEIGILSADSSDPASICELAESATVIITTVGPYQTFGEALVKACVETGTDYVDLCGEPHWIRAMIDKYDSQAHKTGARIVFSCGFDSIPSDLGVQFLQRAAIERFGEPFAQIKCRVMSMSGSYSGGTVVTSRTSIDAARSDEAIMNIFLSPFALTPGFEGPTQPLGHKPFHDEHVDGWVGPFLMATINCKTVHRTNFLLAYPYGKGFQYSEMMFTGVGEEGEALAVKLATTDILEESSGGRNPGEGPSAEERQNSHYHFRMIGIKSDEKASLVAEVIANDDPGYVSTSKMIVQSALCLLENRATPGGVHTPGSALNGALVERLTANADITFSMFESYDV